MKQGCSTFLGVLAALAVILAAAWYLGQDYLRRTVLDPDPVSVAQSSLQSLREQNRLTTFQARYVAVVTSSQSRMGLSAKKTMIMPGTVRYEVDMSKLEQRNLSWDAATRRLTVTLPPVEVVGPEVDLNNIREYGEGGILTTFTDSEERLDAANRAAGQKELLRQAREPAPMRLARDAARRAVERSLMLPLRAAGVDATVDVRFPDETRGPDGEIWDVSRSPAQVLKDLEESRK